MDDLIVAMLREVSVSTHKHRLKTYENVFTGAEAVQFLLKNEVIPTGQDVGKAIAVGNLLIRRYI